MTREEAIKIAYGISGTKAQHEALEFLIPELRESEDERIRKKLIETVGYFRSRGIDQQLCEEFLAYLEKQVHVPWSEEDEKMRNLIVAIFEVNHPDGFFKANELDTTDMRGVHTEEIISWLKSIPLNLKKKNEDAAKLCSNEWNEEDERIIDTIVSVLGQYIDYKAVSGTGFGYATPRYSKEIDFLKSLRPSWKPSEEQMDALRVTIDFMPDTFKPRCTLITLQNGLEKLI